MQTFLPYPEFERTARVLDNTRLGNQCYRECKTLLSGGWENHPASLMWRGYELYLADYAWHLAKEMQRRGAWKPGVAERWLDYYEQLAMRCPMSSTPPPWLGDERLHRSHQSNLKRKDPEHYGHFCVPDDIPYFWPSKEPEYHALLKKAV